MASDAMNRDAATAMKVPPNRLTCTLVATVAALLLAILATNAIADVQVCTPGAGVGRCTSPRGVAVDFETGNLYVADNGNDRVDIFKSNGKENGTPSSFPVTDPVWIAVDNSATSPSQHDVYLSTGFTVKKFTPSGVAAGEFGEQGDGTPEPCQVERADDRIAVGPNGVVYLADAYDRGGNDFVNRIVKFDATGNCIGEVPLFEEGERAIVDLAVDSTGAIYVTVSRQGLAIRKYDASGTLVKQFEIREASGLAVDAGDNLFAEQRGEDVRVTEFFHFFTKYDSTGAVVRRFGYATSGISGFPGIAARQSADGTLYESNASTGVHYFSEPSPGPVIFPKPCRVKAGTLGSVRATLQAEVNPEGKATTIKAEYLTQAQWEAGGFTNPGVKTVEEPLDEGATDFELHEAALKAEPLQSETKYRCRFVATNADSGPGGTAGEEGTFETGPPFEFGAAWTEDVSQTSATINAEGNPKGAPATGQIEYVADAQYQANGFTDALSAPTPPLDYGAGEAMVLRSARLSDLTPGTVYHYRLRANNGTPPEGIVCPGGGTSCPVLEHSFRTYAPEAAGADTRHYELVSPGEKNSAEVGGPRNGAGFAEARSILVFAAAASGEAITYTSWISFGAAQGAPATSQYLAKRTPGGWSTDNISPFGFQSNLFVPPYMGFSPDLRFGAFKAAETSLAPGCPAGLENFYLHEGESGATRCLTPEAPDTTNKFGYCFLYGGASEDGSRVFFKAATNARYDGAPPLGSIDANLYEAHDGQIHLVSVLAGETPAAAGISSFGMFSPESCQTGQTVLRHAISADGTKAIWTNQATPPDGPTQLLDRINGSETVQIDKKQSGSGESGNGTYWAASKDGSVVYFTSPNRLLSGVKAEPGAPDLYRYDFSKSPESARLSDLTIKGGAPGNVKGVLGASDDGAVVYYVAGSALTPEAEVNAAGQHAEAGKNNLYVYDSGEGKNHFIAILSKEDQNDWETQPKVQSARVSPDGQHLTFLSVEAKTLAGYDNTLVKSDGRFGGGEQCRIGDEGGFLAGSSLCPQAFLYDKQSKGLTCASCNPSGARPLGPATLPGWTNMAEGPRYLSDEGSRLFFESFDRLLPADESLERDVYEFERPGSGSCDAADPNFMVSSGGCLFLVSSGRSSDESHLIDASADGRDAFLSTREKLVGWDENENFDIYDYREGGGFAEPTATPICAGEAGCISPPSPAPSATAPATLSFEGPGNVKPKQAKHKKKHAKKKQRKSKKKHAGKKRRAGR
jgi:DNA-binding beta-propeller fold protein YncE